MPRIKGSQSSQAEQRASDYELSAKEDKEDIINDNSEMSLTSSIFLGGKSDRKESLSHVHLWKRPHLRVLTNS
jgi:hypothetical protein